MKSQEIERAAEIAKGVFGLGQERPVVVLDQANIRDDAAIHLDMHYELEMGVSFRQFAVRHRLSQTARQLATTDHLVKAIALEWGFTDTSHLHRLFKQHYDCTPIAYRETRKQ